MKLLSILEKAEKEKPSKLKCPKCGKEGSRVDKEGHVVAYGCFYCSPVRVPKKRK